MKSSVYALPTLFALALLTAGCQQSRSEATPAVAVELTSPTATGTMTTPAVAGEPFEISSPDRLDEAVRQIVGQNLPASDIERAAKK